MSDLTPHNETAQEAAPRDQAAGDAQAPIKKSGNGLVFLPVAIFVLLALMFGFSLVSGDPSRVPSALIGQPAPDRELQPLPGLTRNGQPVPSFRRADLTRGQVSVVNFWASWCGPCVDEHPLLIALAERTGAPVFGVNYKDPNNGGLKFLQRLGNPYTAVAVDPNGRAAIDWGVYGMPETFLVDGTGAIIYKHVGPITPAILEAKIIPAIQAARAAGS
ncbi:MAG: DsbE family thiol:disulfide interchange protein [Pseudomonadota bacterium]